MFPLAAFGFATRVCWSICRKMAASAAHFESVVLPNHQPVRITNIESVLGVNE